MFVKDSLAKSYSENFVYTIGPMICGAHSFKEQFPL